MGILSELVDQQRPLVAWWGVGGRQLGPIRQREREMAKITKTL